MAVTLDPAKAQTILTALRGVDQQAAKYNSLEHTAIVFVNAFGELIILYNGFNHKTVGKIINENRFQIGRLQFNF